MYGQTGTCLDNCARPVFGYQNYHTDEPYLSLSYGSGTKRFRYGDWGPFLDTIALESSMTLSFESSVIFNDLSQTEMDIFNEPPKTGCYAEGKYENKAAAASICSKSTYKSCNIDVFRSHRGSNRAI